MSQLSGSFFMSDILSVSMKRPSSAARARARAQKKQRRGFTLIELIIVVVVIAILATLAFVGYAGIQERARMNSALQAINSASKKISLFSTTNGGYPATLADADIRNSGNTTYAYERITEDGIDYFCLTATVDASASYFVTSRTDKPAAGSCIKLEAWWPFNGSDEDLSYADRDPTSNNGLPSDGQNQSSDAFQFGEGNGFVVPSVDGGVLQDVSYGADWSLAVWAQSTGPSDNEALIVGRVGCNGGLYTQSGFYQFAIKTSNANCWSGSAGLNGIAVDTSWRHLAGVYQGGVMRFYVDGRLVNSGFIAQIYGYSTTMRIGGTGSRVFNGKIDDVRIYSRALSPEEITYIYRGGAY